jgi:hypothetical protein
MGNVIQGLISFFEIVILGVISLSVIGYALLTFHPVVGSLVRYAKSLKQVRHSVLKRFDIGQESSQAGTEKNYTPEVMLTFQGLILIGLLYFVGVITNNASYSFLHHNNVHIITKLYADAETAQSKLTLADTNMMKLNFVQLLPLSKESLNLSYKHMATLPFLKNCFFNCSDNLTETEAKHYGSFLATQARIRTKSKDAHEELLKFLRIQRGIVFFLFWILMVSFVKLVLSIVARIFPKWTFLYKNAIDWEAYFNEGSKSDLDAKAIDSRKEKIRASIATNITIFPLAVFFYYQTIVWYTKVAVFYHVNILGAFKQI